MTFRPFLVAVFVVVASPAHADAPAAPVPLVLRDGPRPVRDAGIGASLGPVADGVVLERLAPGMGADAAGLKAGDVIVAVDGKPTKGREIAEVASWIRGERDTTVQLQVRRAGAAESKLFSIARQSLKDPRMKKLVAELRADAAKSPAAGADAAPVSKVERVDPTGKPAPMLTVDRWVNRAPSLGKTLYGRYLLIDFWATWCGPCRKTLPELANLARELEPKGLTVVGLSIDEDVASVESFLADSPLPYSVGWTMGSEFDRFGTSGIPTLVLVGPDGVVRWVHEGGVLPIDAIRAEVAKLKQKP